MSDNLILIDRLGKKFHRTWAGALADGLQDALRQLLRLKPRQALGKAEFWALREVSLMVKRGECLGVIGPNGAGKSTLLRLLGRELRADAGRMLTLGSIRSLLRTAAGLQGQFSGRENIYMQCQQLGLDKQSTDALLPSIMAFAGLESAIDAAVKTYSDGMAARLEFAIATSVPADIFLVDEVLAFGDIAFQIRALNRLNELKQNGAAIVFVSHSEMNVRYVADRCLLLFDGRGVALGEPDALFYQYYQAVGYLGKRLQALTETVRPFPDLQTSVKILGLKTVNPANALKTGEPLSWLLEFEVVQPLDAVSLHLHIRDAADVLVAFVDSGQLQQRLTLREGRGQIRLDLPFFPLTAGIYRLAAGFADGEGWLAYRSRLAEIPVVHEGMGVYQGLAMLDAEIAVVSPT